jgi:hypothetical protein
MNLQRQELTLSTGSQVLYEYDPETDLLEIIFHQSKATAAVELTESIVLRFNWETSQPLSLSFLSISRLIEPGEYGEVHFQLLTDEWPVEAKSKVLAMLRQPPLNEFLSLSSYTPANSHQVIPLTTIKDPRLSLLVA